MCLIVSTNWAFQFTSQIMTLIFIPLIVIPITNYLVIRKSHTNQVKIVR